MSQYNIYKDKVIPGVGVKGSSVFIVGESPGFDEHTNGVPFVGEGGKILNGSLSRWGIPREECYIDNLSQYRPWSDNFMFLLGTSILEEGIRRVRSYIETYKPVVVIACGNWPMLFLTGKGKRDKNGVTGIGNWRGSILPYKDETGRLWNDIKVIPVFHPAFVSRYRSTYPIFDADIKRCAHDSKFRGLNYPEREIISNPSGLVLEQCVQELCNSPKFTSDIETIKNSTTILCIGFSPRPNRGIVIANDTPERVRAISRILYSSARKCFHFGIFDSTQLGLNGFKIELDSVSVNVRRPYYWDSYVAAHVLEPELPKTLAYETSIRTREPYYKSEGKEESDQKGWSRRADKERLYRYCGKDVCTDFEIWEQQEQEISEMDQGSRDIFSLEMRQLYVQRHISLSGMLIDPARLELFRQALIARWAKLQYLLNGVAGREINVKSPALKDWLYGKDKLNLPTRFKDKRPTTNDDALVSLIGYCKDKVNVSVREETKRKYRLQLAVLKAIREIREIRQRYSSYVMAKRSIDDRSRATYKNGPETGRWASQKFVDGTGYNHQTNPRDPIEVADEEFEKYKNMNELLGQMTPEEMGNEDDEEAA